MTYTEGMIDIPRGSSTAPPSSAATSATAATSAVDMAASSVAESVEAVVVEVKARQASGNLEKPAWDILLKLTPSTATTSSGQAVAAQPVSGQPVPGQSIPGQSVAQPATATATASTAVPASATTLPNSSTPLTSLTPDSLRALQSGQTLLVRTLAEFPLPVNTRLLVNASSQQGIRIQQMPVTESPVRAQFIALLKQWAPQQQGVQPLLANVLNLLNTTAINALPARVQATLQQLLQTLPRTDNIQQPGQMQAVVENSGLLLEAKLARLIAQLQKGTGDAADTVADKNAHVATGSTTSGNALAGLARTVRETLQRLAPEPRDAGSAPALRLDGAKLETTVGQDLKLALQRLESALRDAQGSAGKAAPETMAGSADVSVPGAGKTLAGNAVVGGAALPVEGDGTDGNPADTDAPAGKTAATPAGTTSLTETPEQQLAKLLARNTRHGAAGIPVTTERPAQHYALQHYTVAAKDLRSDAARITSAETLLLPPLPGQLLVQAQPRSRASLKGDEMADAIVNILLKQVRGSLARMTLHQLTSAAHKQDSAAQPTISFDIPFLHGGQVDVFQFRIEEEKNSAPEAGKEKQLGKRWQVQLGFDIEGLGPMFCQLSLVGSSMAVTFWAAWEQTLEQTRAHFSFLEQSLTGMGIHVEKMQGHLGMPENDRTGVRNQLVDIKT